jgi:hypothetical protein
VFPDPFGEKHSLGYKHLALHLLVGAALSGGRVAWLTKTDLENSISGYGQEFFTVPKAKKSVNAFLSARRPPDKWVVVSFGWDPFRNAGHSRPAMAGGIQSVDNAFPKVCRVDSRFRGNDCGLERPCLANDTSPDKWKTVTWL